MLLQNTPAGHEFVQSLYTKFSGVSTETQSRSPEIVKRNGSPLMAPFWPLSWDRRHFTTAVIAANRPVQYLKRCADTLTCLTDIPLLTSNHSPTPV